MKKKFHFPSLSEMFWRKDSIKLKRRQCQIELLIQAGETFKLTVKVFDKPICDLASMPWREKMHYAGLLFTKYMQFEKFIGKALQDLKPKSNGEMNNANT